MAREGREVWAKRVDRLRESDLTAVEFAREIGVNVHTLRHWKWKLEGGERGSDRRPARPKPATETPTFLEFAAPSPVAGIGAIRVEVGSDVVVCVETDADEAALRRVFTALGVAR